MIISHCERFVFVHIPKVAGKTVRKQLAQYADHANRYWGIQAETQLGRGIDKAHVPLIDLKSLYSQDYEYFDKYFVFAFVRNPYDRFYSAFQEHARQRKLPNSVNFNDYVQVNITADNIRYNWKFIHFCPQNYFTHIGYKLQVDFIGCYENLKADLKRLSCLLKLNDNALDIIQRSSESSLKYYDQKTLNLVNQLYDNDFNYFGYSKLTRIE